MLETPMSLVERYDINWFTGLSTTVYLIQNSVCVCVGCVGALFRIAYHQILALPTSFSKSKFVNREYSFPFILGADVAPNPNSNTFFFCS